MTRAIRTWLFVVSAVALFAVMTRALSDLPPFGHYRGPYGDAIARIGVFERHATDLVTAVNFDFRGFDTLGEETILFMSVVGGALLLRRQRDETEEKAREEWNKELARRDGPDPSEAVRATTLGLVGPLVAFGIYVVTHGHLTPGGGFQGGVILATAPLLVYIADDIETFKRITHKSVSEAAEAAGIFGYIAVGALGLAMGSAYLQNVLPLGTTGHLFSSGTIFLVNLATGLAVTSGFVHLMQAFLEQSIESRSNAE